MRKIVLFLLSLIFVASCTRNDYVIEGKAENLDLEGGTVYIAERVGRTWQTLDSIFVENGKFSFKGEVDSVRIVYLKFNYASRNNTQVFVLEPGEIKIVLDSAKNTISGTKQNDILNKYNEAEAELYKRAGEADAALNEAGASDAEKEQEQQKIFDEYKALMVDYASKYANTIVGNHLFSSTYYYLTIAEKEAVIAKFNDKTRKIERIQKIIQNLEIEKKTAEGNPFTDFEQTSPDGQKISLSSLVGKSDYVLVDFWASWCGPCIRSFPELKEFYNKHKGSQLEILGVSLDNDEEAWKNAIAQYELTWQHISDLKGWDNEAAKAYAVSGIPNTVLIDKNGNIAGRNLSIGEIKALLSSEKE
ncbi:MAG: AhpC/TSA family protein [Prevotellaceae bacterium]|jgi:peroxiredoxin|nr:AhpC/TSA family protein [Prevotellaceae bacterium]